MEIRCLEICLTFEHGCVIRIELDRYEALISVCSYICI
jgi:hypothetical protein